MKVKFQTVAAGPDFSAKVGDVLDLDEHTAELLIEAGAVVKVVVKISKPSEVLKPVIAKPVQPKVAEPEPEPVIAAVAEHPVKKLAISDEASETKPRRRRRKKK